MPTYSARFTGRTKGAIGIFHECSALVDGETPAAAHEALYESFEHISPRSLSLIELPIRYVVTHIYRKAPDLEGLRVLSHAAQGRCTYETAEQAHAWIEAARANNSADTLRQLYGEPDTLEVRAVPCWPGHFDPIRTVGL